ncbi:MAG: acyl-CoA dehydrogenase [Euryarchaeota archaeon]|jgi:alkylation response protein AidB-like acyl-CoA dehydrogenase|nr:acyl-CoA dehydrogenase [Euryarchaeota archaeon]|tara:strand:- start:7571 stop:9373 length:1803 start_codon:yes stop_codon:yes gene_type:complete
MVVYKAPYDEYDFLFYEVFDVLDLAKRLGHDDLDRDFIRMIMEGWGDYCTEVLLPLNEIGDREGLVFESGEVTMPSGFVDAWKEGVEAGWFATTCRPEHGGMGLPQFVRNGVDEIAIAANMSLSVVPALGLGVYELVTNHGVQELIDHYAEYLASGHWCSTMCLTEPHAGTDLGIIYSKAVPQDDGSYRVTGTKIFITAGEHDLSDNIVHMVLAKTPDAPEGTKGISLFIVPKFLPKDWESGSVEGLSHDLSDARNGVTCSGIEEKMGLHASPTCVLNFDDSVGWLVGELNAGMPLMFEMMNRERLATGMMGLGLGEIAYQNALAWARERRQGRDLKGIRDPSQAADNILVHPDVRRMLLTAKVNNEGCRALGVWVGTLLDQLHSDDAEMRERAEALIALLTPVVKAHFTDLGCETTSTCMQVMGGAGYCSEYGVEQFYRDVRISKIWEGTNGIQALDLAGRKITQDLGRNLRYLMWPLVEFIEENRDIPEMAEFNKPLHKGVRGLQQLTLLMISQGMGNPHFLAAGATDYCRYFGNIMLAYMWARMARVCLEHPDSDFHQAKLASARVFFNRIYPETISLGANIQAGHKDLMNYPEAMM